MKIDEKLSPRSRMLLFSTLELLRKEVRKQFEDWKDADDWLFAQLDFTKSELAQIYKDRGVMYYDASAVDPSAAKKERENQFEFVYDFGDGYKVAKLYGVKDEDTGVGDVYATKRDFDLFAGTENYTEVYCVIDMNTLLVPDECADYLDTVTEAIEDYKLFKTAQIERARLAANRAYMDATIPLSHIDFVPLDQSDRGNSLDNIVNDAKEKAAKGSANNKEKPGKEPER